MEKTFKTTQFRPGQEVRMPYATTWEGKTSSGAAKMKIVRQLSDDEYLVEYPDGFREVQEAENLETVQ